MRKLLEKDVKNIIEGATLLGAGGGGSAGPALVALKQLYKKIDYIEMYDPTEISDKSTGIISAGMGSPEVLLKRGWNSEQVYAFERAEKLLGKMDFVVSVETGGFNSFTGMQTAGLKHKKLIDGDGAGRAIPELEQTTFSLHGIPSSPLFLADSKGNSAILYPKDASMAETMGRALTTVFEMTAGIALYYMDGKQLKDSIVPNTLSLNESIGKKLGKTKNIDDMIAEILKDLNGKLLTKGKVKKRTVEVRGAFDFGRVYINDVIVDYKNENMIAWKDNKPVAMVPDSICWLRTDGTPLTNADLKEGMDIAVILKKAHPKFRGKKAFSTFKGVLGLLGYKGEFVGIEELP
jgi:hypothetical protein